MYTHFNRKIRAAGSKLLMLLVLIGLPLFSLAQYYPVSVTSVVYPPFSPKLSYYLDHADKVNVTLINTSARPVDVYIQGHFTGDNGIDVSTEEGYKPELPITLVPNIPFQLSPSNIEKVFSLDHLVFSGITKDEAVRNQGFPEGTYQMCFRVFSYETNQPLSSENTGCSNPIFIQYVDPPVILYPTCGDTIDATPVQNLIFSWTTPPTAGIVYSYHFIMVEVQPGDRSPYDAIVSAGQPYFFETEVNSNQLIMGPAEPQLTEGRTYAFAVQAVDVSGEIQFKNYGTSEVCWFTYKSPFKIEPVNTAENLVSDLSDAWDGFSNNFGMLPFTSVHGQMHCKLASLATNNAAATVPKQGNTSSVFNYGMFSVNTGNANNNKKGLSGTAVKLKTDNTLKNISFAPPFGSGTLNEKVLSVNNSEPLRNTMIRLVARFGFAQPDGFSNVKSFINNGLGSIKLEDYRFFDLQGNEISYERVENTIDNVLDVTTTDAQGNYSFDFQTDYFTGPFYAVAKSSPAKFGSADYSGFISLKIEVINQKFCSPDVDIFASPGDNITLAPQVALIKDFNVKLTVLSQYDGHKGSIEKGDYQGYDNKPKAIAGGDTIKNAIVKVLRDIQKVGNEHPSILLAEGQKLGSVTKNANGEFKDVFIGITDKNGQVTIPHLVEHWEVTDGKDQSPYYLSVTTRSDKADSTYENTIYNFEPYFDNLIGSKISNDAAGTTLHDDDAGWAGSGAPLLYNHFYNLPPTLTNRDVFLKAAPPEIKGRLMVKTNLENVGLANQEVRLYAGYTADTPGLLEKKQVTNSSGFFRFKNLWVNVDENGGARGPFRRIHVSSSLYKTVVRPPQNEAPLNLKYGELIFQEIQLEPRQLLKGEVVNEKGEPVASYIKVLPNNPYVKTEPRWEYDSNGDIYRSGEYFEVAAHSYGVTRIEILPLSNKFYHDTVEVSEFDPHIRKTFTVASKLHRLKLQLYDKTSNGVISNATVLIGDTLAIGKTNSAGVAEIVFPSPGEQFVVKVLAENYSPLQTSFSIPVGKNWQNETVKLEYALHISGTVTEQNNSQPIDSALVFTQLQSTDGHSLYIKTYSDKNGNYKLNGIPHYNTPTKIVVKAVKNGEKISYIGSEKEITVKSSMVTSGFDFQLKKADKWNLSNIWGLPVTVEELKTRPQLGTTISGYFYNLPHNADFNTLNNDEKVYFKNLKIERGTNGEIVPKGDVISTKLYSLPIKIKGGFEGTLSEPMAKSGGNRLLKIKKRGDGAVLGGELQIDLASFKFAYDFHGDLFVGDDTTKTYIDIFRSKTQYNSGALQNSFNAANLFKNRYYLFNIRRLLNGSYPEPITDFRVFGFNASSSYGSSYLQNGTINIGVTLHTDIPVANHAGNLDLKIKAGQIQITKENMDLITRSDKPLEFNLEKWKVIANKGWTFDKTKDALVLKNSTISTGLGINVGIKNWLIRPTALRDGKINMGEGLTLGGITPLILDKNIKPVFNYDAGVGHYRISMVGTTNGPVAWVDKLPATTGRLEFTSLGMLSDNSTVLTLGKHLVFHKLLDVYVDQIMSGKDFFTLAGMPELGIPGFVPTRAEMTFIKSHGKLIAKLEPINGIVDCNANLVYKLEQKKSSQTLVDEKFTTYGDFFIKAPPGKPGDKISVHGFLTKTPNECFIDVVPQKVKFGKEEMSVFKGKISVTNNNWGLLTFDANTSSTGLEDENVVSFSVPGGIKADCNQLEVSDIDTPFGDLSMAYIFSEKALKGELKIKTGLNLGFASIESGMMNMQFDPHGFYLGFTGQVRFSSDTYDGGFLLGVYNSDLNEMAAPILAKFETDRPDFSSLHGFYAIGQRRFVDKSFSLVGIDIAVKAGVGAFVFLDYNIGKFELGGYGYASAVGGVNITGCGFVGVKQSAYGEVRGGYEDKSLSISTCMTSRTSVGACGLEGHLDIMSGVRISTNRPTVKALELNGKCSDFNNKK